MTDQVLSAAPSTARSGAQARARRPPRWAIIPLVFFLGLVAMQLSFVTRMVARDVHSVESDAYTRSMDFDQEQAAFTRFESLGLGAEWQAAGDGATVLRLTGPAVAGLGAVQVHCYRPDDAALDQRLEWERPQQPLALGLPRAGQWRMLITAEHADGPVRATLRIQR